MSTNKKKNGWFFNKSIVDEINAIPENKVEEELGSNVYLMDKNGEKPVERAVERTPERPIEQGTQRAGSADSEIARLQEELQKITEERERELIQQQTDRRIENQKMMNEQERLRSAMGVLETEKEQAQQQVQKLRNESQKLREALKSQEEAEEIAKANQQLQEKMDALLAEMSEKDTQLNELNQVIAEKDASIKSLLEDSDSDSVIDHEALQQLQSQLSQLQKENEALKLEALDSQQEIGEVLVSARKQAKRTVEKAKMDAEAMIRSAEEDLEVVYDRAKEISFEVNESKRDVMEIFKELQNHVDKLAGTKITMNKEL
ncbi:hypothetical protein JZO70_08155 [Enterococcus sp. 669A]|uniref:Uncharacterized protein n=1 Tax=Candidatus Enterococcus moelleringii TaxID=2815325 RepID=A0ABS3L918_9ENTE|nr:hypothetical protein [Enterococcus sp. 669A]MBO1306131.1 hypothetical protein [Enterococcus sp. 669A]